MQKGTLDSELNLKEIEESVKKYWDDIDIKKYISDKYSDKEPIAFVRVLLLLTEFRILVTSEAG